MTSISLINHAPFAKRNPPPPDCGGEASARNAQFVLITRRPGLHIAGEMGLKPSTGTDTIFPPTDWTGLKQAGADEARLDGLIRLYWQPLRIFLMSAFPGSRGEVDTWLLDFTQDRLLKEGWLLRADQTRGRFRDFLKTSLRHYVLDRLSRAEHRHASVPLEQLAVEPAQAEREAEAFDLAWARTVLAETLRRMEADCRDPAASQPRRTRIWDLFRLRLLDPALQEAEPPPYEELVERFGLKSPSEASNTLLSGKRIFKTHLSQVIQEYAGQDQATVEEIRALEEFLARLARRG